MQQFVLKEQIREKIEGKKVVAALFYTFNFDPQFFENYVMPLLVPSKTFRDEMIHNKILWRHCQKEGLIPPITVYCDFFAKDNTAAPSLGYDIHCLRIPAAPQAICNFHSKHIFLLLEGESESSLLMVTGSGNLTSSGWCDNFESISIEELKKDNNTPKRVQTNLLQDMIAGIARLKSSNQELSPAESEISSFLRYVDFKSDGYFCSLDRAFKDFLEQEIFSHDQISEIEIISPYFSGDLQLLHYLKKEKKIASVKCLMPMSKQNEVLLAEEVFTLLQENGLKWCEWTVYEQDNRKKNRNHEVRNPHAKIYRLRGRLHTYTIVGSTNFTNPAWKQYDPRRNEANIETALLYVEQEQPRLLKPITSNEGLIFIERENQDEACGGILGRNMPVIHFVLNWKSKTLAVQVTSQANGCTFHNILSGTVVAKGNNQYKLLPDDIKKLTQNTLIEIEQVTGKDRYILIYYVQQEDIAAKPLDFRLSIANILKYWELLGNEYGQEMILRSVAAQITNESGIEEENRQQQRTLLNEMAAHFNALIKLEKHIFSHPPKDLARAVQYYLLSENVDTLPYYLRDLNEQSAENKILKSFHWMIMRITETNFYGRALNEHTIARREEHKLLAKDLRQRKRDLGAASEILATGIDMTEQQKHWIIRQLAGNYA